MHIFVSMVPKSGLHYMYTLGYVLTSPGLFYLKVLQSDLNTQIFKDLVQFVEKAQDGFVAGEGSKSQSTEIPTAALVTGILWYCVCFLDRFIPLFYLTFGLEMTPFACFQGFQARVDHL